MIDTRPLSFSSLGALRAFAKKQGDKLEIETVKELYKSLGKQEFKQLCRQAAVAMGGFLHSDYPEVKGRIGDG